MYEYELMIEVNTTDVDHLRNTLKSVAFPAWVGVHANISHAAITTGEMKLFAVSVHSAASVPFCKISFFFKFADQTEALSNADVRKASRGRVKSVSRTGDVTTTQSHAGAFEDSPLMDNSASQHTVRVSFTPFFEMLN